MSSEITDPDIEKNHITFNLFVDTADQNYVVARWCYLNGLHLDFFWNGLHSLEKLMKAVLLLNGFSSIKAENGGSNFGHNIVELYEQVKGIASDLLPQVLIKPTNCPVTGGPKLSIISSRD